MYQLKKGDQINTSIQFVAGAQHQWRFCDYTYRMFVQQLTDTFLNKYVLNNVITFPKWPTLFWLAATLALILTSNSLISYLKTDTSWMLFLHAVISFLIMQSAVFLKQRLKSTVRNFLNNFDEISLISFPKAKINRH